jgi:hypothetical protein
MVEQPFNDLPFNAEEEEIEAAPPTPPPPSRLPLTIMYDAQINSPEAYLTLPINETDTEISVTDASLFPPPPNQAVIGVNENAETVLYNGIDYENNKLLEVTRGFEGAISAWNDGERIARNFTHYDHQAFKENILALDNYKIDREGDKVLSQNDFTDELKTKLDNIQSGATHVIVENSFDSASEVNGISVACAAATDLTANGAFTLAEQTNEIALDLLDKAVTRVESQDLEVSETQYEELNEQTYKSVGVELKNTGVESGAYTKVTVDGKGRVVSGAFLAAGDVPNITLAKITDAGTAAARNVGTLSGQIPVLQSNNKLDLSVIPEMSITKVWPAR